MKSFNTGILAETHICARCGYCQTVCPISHALGWESTGPRGRIAIAQHVAAGQGATTEHARRVYQCTLCGHCREVCPTHIDTCALWLDLRERLAADNQLAAFPLKTISANLAKFQNVTGDPPENRLMWQDNLETPIANLNSHAGAEVVYFVGCVAGLYGQTQSIPQAFAQILAHANVAFTTLGGDEQCCGFPLLGLGQPAAARERARHNLAMVHALGAHTLVAACPSCYHVWRDDYPRLLDAPLNLRVRHASEFLGELIADGRLNLQPLAERVTYHDPCDLGRNSGVYEPPRQVLAAIPGLELIEMADNRANALCCGGGGNMEAVDAELVGAIAARRLTQALDTGASVIATPCQQCKRTLTNAARKARARIKTLDLTEIVWRSLAA